MIAAQAMSHRLTLVTADIREFNRVQGMAVSIDKMIAGTKIIRKERIALKVYQFRKKGTVLKLKHTEFI